MLRAADGAGPAVVFTCTQAIWGAVARAAGEVFAGGQTVTVDAPLAELPLFHRLA